MTATVAVLAGLLVAAAPVYAQQINDPQIAAIVVTANQVDVDAGALAAARAASPEVKQFAERMVTDHESVNRSATELAARLKLTPEENDTSRALKAGGEKNLAALKKLTGAAFDKAYVDHEVAYHAQVLEALDKTLVPNAANAELKALLVKVRPAFVAHLEHARQIQRALKAARPAHTVTIDAVSFRPATITIAPGDTVVWVNKDVVPHTSTAGVRGGFDSGTIAAGASWTRTFPTKGALAYVCQFHPTMKGTVLVR